MRDRQIIRGHHTNFFRIKYGVPGILILLALVMAGGGCNKGDSSGSGGNAPGEPTIKWQKSDLTVNKKKYTLEYGRYDRPVALKVVPLAQTRRDTPLGAWISWQSHLMQGKDDKELAAYFDHFTNGPDLRKKLKGSAEDFFKNAREVDDRPAAIGLVKYAHYTIVVYSTGRGSWRGACMVLRGDKWTIDDTSKLSDPVLQKLIGTNFDGFKQATSRPK